MREDFCPWLPTTVDNVLSITLCDARSAKISRSFQVIGLGTAGSMYLFLQNFMKDDLYSPMGPVLFAGVMAYFVASSFAALLDMVGSC